MSLPPLAPIPPANVRLSLAPEEWSACLDAWLTLADATARRSPKELAGAKSGDSSLISFLRSVYREAALASPADETLRTPKALDLQKSCFRLVSRMLLQPDQDNGLLDWEFLADFCHAHGKSAALARLLTKLWKDNRSTMESTCQPKKADLTSQLESRGTADMQGELNRLAPVLRASPEAALYFMVGSDYVDGLVAFYSRSSAVDDRKAVVLAMYLGLESLVKVDPQNVSMLSDHLYSLKSSSDKNGSQNSLLADLVTNTPLAARLRRLVTGKASDRLFKLLDSLDTYRTPSLARPRKHPRRKPDKGKGKAMMPTAGDDEMHMHRLSLITQIQDLFPDLGSAFIMKLLDEYLDDVEQVTAHLLDDSLPAHLRDLDRTEETPIASNTSPDQPANLAPRSTPPELSAEATTFIPSRRNVFDDDDFDRLEVDTSRLHIGKKNPNPNNQTANKSAILSALAAFDSDDDERDDTYDVDDVGGTVDTAHPDGEPAASNARTTQEDMDATLLPVWKSSPELFGRTFDIRRGQARQGLKAETGMTDEAIEGWALMLQRDPKRVARLESRSGAGAFDGKQTELGRSSYRESETEDSDAGGPNAPRGGFRGRGRGRGGGGRGGGSVAGPSGDAGTANAQRRKEESKGQRANHNRRDQRARKMARGGFAG